jgi:Zn-dependent protease
MGLGMFELLFAAAICALGLRAVQGSFVTDTGRLSLPPVDLGSVRMWILLSLALILVFKLKYGTALLVALMLHELGHVAAHRILGHGDARFRLVPLLDGAANSERMFKNRGQEFFATIMGAGFSLVPMVAALVLARIFETSLPQISTLLYALGSTIAALNFVNLLPLLPFDGGRCLRQILTTLSPVTGLYVILFFSAGAAALSFVHESMSLIMLVCLGGLVFFRPEDNETIKAPMSPSTAWLALAVYLTTLSAHAIGGWWLIRWYFW